MAVGNGPTGPPGRARARSGEKAALPVATRGRCPAVCRAHRGLRASGPAPAPAPAQGQHSLGARRPARGSHRVLAQGGAPDARGGGQGDARSPRPRLLLASTLLHPAVLPPVSRPRPAGRWALSRAESCPAVSRPGASARPTVAPPGHGRRAEFPADRNPPSWQFPPQPVASSGFPRQHPGRKGSLKPPVPSSPARGLWREMGGGGPSVGGGGRCSAMPRGAGVGPVWTPSGVWATGDAEPALPCWEVSA